MRQEDTSLRSDTPPGGWSIQEGIEQAYDEAVVEMLTREVARLARFVGVSQTWDIIVTIWDEAEADGAAMIRWVPGYQKATIFFDLDAIRHATLQQVEAYILHELLHLIFAPLDDMMKAEIGPNSYLFNKYYDQCERVVDAVTFLMINARKEDQWKADHSPLK